MTKAKMLVVENETIVALDAAKQIRAQFNIPNSGG